MTRKIKEKKHLIYSDIEPNSNCHENCNREVRGFCECDNYTFNDEVQNLNKELGSQVIAIAQMGTWQGRRQGYKRLGSNLTTIFSVSEQRNEWYSNGKDILSTQIHHDGRNHIIFRLLRTDRTREGIEKFLKDIYDGKEITPRKLSAYTTSLHPHVASIYGWQ